MESTGRRPVRRGRSGPRARRHDREENTYLTNVQEGDQEGETPVMDNPGRKDACVGAMEEVWRNEVQNIVETLRVCKQNPIMACTGRRPMRRGRSGQRARRNKRKENSYLNNAHEGGQEGETPVTDNPGRKDASAGAVEEVSRDQVQIVVETSRVCKQNPVMASTGRRPVRRGRSGRRVRCDNREENTYLSNAQEGGQEGDTPVMDNHGRKDASSGAVEEESGDEVHCLMERFGADIVKPLQAKKRRLEMSTNASVNLDHQTTGSVWKKQEQMLMRAHKHSQQIQRLIQLLESEMKKSEEQELTLQTIFQQQQKLLQQAEVIQSQTQKSIKTLHEQFLKDIEEMKKNHKTDIDALQKEFMKDLVSMQRKFLMVSVSNAL